MSISTALLAATLLGGGPSPAPAPSAPSSLDDARFEIHLGLHGRVRGLGGLAGGGGVQIGLGVRLWRGLYFEAGVAESVIAGPPAGGSTDDPGFRHLGPHTNESADAGAAGGDPEGDPDPSLAGAPATAVGPRPGEDALLAGQILLGLRYEIRTPKLTAVRPSVFVGATHLHEATLAEFAAAPGKTLAGTGRFIRHRTGVQAGLGLRVPFPARWGRVAPRFSARFDLDAAYYFDALPGRVQLGLGAGLQVVF